MIEPLLVHCMVAIVGKSYGLPEQVCTDVRDTYAVLYTDDAAKKPELQPYLEIMSMAQTLVLCSCRSGRTYNIGQVAAELMYQYHELTKNWSTGDTQLIVETVRDAMVS